MLIVFSTLILCGDSIRVDDVLQANGDALQADGDALRARAMESAWSVQVEKFGVSLGEVQASLEELNRSAYQGLGKHIGDLQLFKKIEQIKRYSEAGGMDKSEYFQVMKHVRDHAPQKLLVWGVGYDSVMLDHLNEGGDTLFLEMNAKWVEKTNARYLNYLSYDESLFRTSVGTYTDFLNHPHEANLAAVDEKCWDTVIIDSPNGLHPQSTGRAVPIFTTKKGIERCNAAKTIPHPLKTGRGPSVTVFLHDCNRQAEHALSSAFLGTPTAESTTSRKLRRWVFPTGI